MSVVLNLHEKQRVYKIEIFGLQDNFIGVLQTYDDNFLGQVINPRINIKKDGTQTFSCDVPKYYINEATNNKIINPRWEESENGIIAENTRVIKVTINFENGITKVYPFIIDKITNKRDKDFSVYKQIEASGLAFSELGKVGYKLELNSQIVEEDFKKDPSTVATIDYWLDKIFPNEKDGTGKITRWLTPWCYEVRMDWRGYYDEFTSFVDKDIPEYNIRQSNKIYENAYVADWKIHDNNFYPISVNSFIEKARYIDCSNSNKYNITQTLAEVFEVFCTYEYSCDTSGHFKKTYTDNEGRVWTGKKVIFFNKAIKSDNPYVLNYERNLQSIKRVIDSSEIYSKMYVTPVASEIMNDGYISIANTKANPLLDDYILNFDYLYSVGSIKDWQMEEIEKYKIQIYKINKELINLEYNFNELTVKLNDLEAEYSSHENSLQSAHEQLINYQQLRDSEVTNAPVLKNKNNSYSVVMIPQPNTDIVLGTFKLEGINPSTIVGYADYTYEKKIFETKDLIFTQSINSNQNILNNSWYVINDDYGFPNKIYTSKHNPIFESEEFYTQNFDISTGVIVYFNLEYFPKNKYSAICQNFENLINKELVKLEELKNIIGSDEDIDEEKWTGLKLEISENTKKREILKQNKDNLTFNLERILGPALREGYWQPDSYEDPGQGYKEEIGYSKDISSKANSSLIFDDLPFSGEQLDYYYIDPNNITEESKNYYPFIDLSSIYNLIDSNNPTAAASFCITLLHPSYQWILQNNGDLQTNKSYYFLIDGIYYAFTSPNIEFLKNDIITLRTDNFYLNKNPYISIERNGEMLYSIIETIILEKTPTSEDGFNITNTFMGINGYLSKRHLYHNSGFVFSFLRQKESKKIIPVALLQNTDINYQQYSSVYYSIDNNQTIIQSNLQIQENKAEYNIVYPRIYINFLNVNYNSDTLQLTIKRDNNNKKLINYEDYNVYLREGYVYINLKITNNNLLQDILKGTYEIIYQVSRANEMLYLDAIQVAKDNSKPKYSYEVSAAMLPHAISSIELGELVYINDYSIDIFKEYGYISEISYALDKPSQDSLVIENYKTKFEDLFASITVQNEAMKQNSSLYNIAAAAFTSTGQVKQETLQNTLDDNNFLFNFSSSNLTIDSEGGIVLTNTTPYSNGVYGQIALRGGGVFLSDELDAEGKRLWSSALTPKGFNTNLIEAGQIDTAKIKIYSALPNQMRPDTSKLASFIWDANGLSATKIAANNNEENSTITFNQDGFFYYPTDEAKIKNNPAFEISWNGIMMASNNQKLKITNEYGLQMYGLNNSTPAVTFGKNDQFGYGMFFTNSNGQITLQARDDGYLHVIDKIYAGEGAATAGISGGDIKFWAGTDQPSETSPFRVDKDGNVYAKKFNTGNSATLSALSREEDITTIGATAIMADAFMYAPDLETDFLTAEEIVSGDITIQNGALIFQKGSTKAILYFNGEKLVVEYE